jgi:CRP-like cAMP-binding protein
MKKSGELGKVYEDGEVIVRQGDTGDCMYVIQEGRVQVFVQKDGQEVLLREPSKGEIFIGEMGVFEKQTRSATVRARGTARVLTLDKKQFLKRVQEDPSLVFLLVQNMSHRIRELSDEVTRLKERP